LVVISSHRAAVAVVVAVSQIRQQLDTAKRDKTGVLVAVLVALILDHRQRLAAAHLA
jgi:hypothetical protein